MTEVNFVAMVLTFFADAAVLYFLVRKHLKSIADPLFFFVLISAFSLALGSFVSDDPWLVVRIYGYFTMFYAGFLVTTGKTQQTRAILLLNDDMRKFRAIVLGCAIVYFAANAMMWLNSGVILFADDPSLQKSEAYAGGLGIVRRFNWGVGTFTLIASIYWVLSERRVLSMLTTIVVSLIAMTGGGKSALLPAIFAVGLYLTRPFASVDKTDYDSRLRSLVPLLFGIALVPVLIVLVIENGSLKGAFDAFILRLFYFGDVLLFWGQDFVRSGFSNLGPIDYFKDTFGSILGGLRLIPYEIPMGNQFVQYTLPAGTDFPESIGPNLPFYVRGELYLGIIVAPLYSFCVGATVGCLRRCFIRYHGHSLLSYSMLAFVVITSFTLPLQEELAIGQFFDFALLLIPIYGVATLLSANMTTRQVQTHIR